MEKKSKKMVAKVVMVLFAVMMVFALTGCEKAEDKVKGNTYALDTEEFYCDFNESCVSFDIREIIKGYTDSKGKLYLRFNSDGKTGDVYCYVEKFCDADVVNKAVSALVGLRNELSVDEDCQKAYEAVWPELQNEFYTLENELYAIYDALNYSYVESSAEYAEYLVRDNKFWEKYYGMVWEKVKSKFPDLSKNEFILICKDFMRDNILGNLLLSKSSSYYQSNKHVEESYYASMFDKDAFLTLFEKMLQKQGGGIIENEYFWITANGELCHSKTAPENVKNFSWTQNKDAREVFISSYGKTIPDGALEGRSIENLKFTYVDASEWIIDNKNNSIFNYVKK